MFLHIFMGKILKIIVVSSFEFFFVIEPIRLIPVTVVPVVSSIVSAGTASLISSAVTPAIVSSVASVITFAILENLPLENLLGLGLNNLFSGFFSSFLLSVLFFFFCHKPLFFRP